jgi:hypothetical protein
MLTVLFPVIGMMAAIDYRRVNGIVSEIQRV